MSRIAVLVVCLCFFASLATGQTYRTYTGWGNNVDHPEYGSNHSLLQSNTTDAFANGFSTPAGQNRANPRLISNYLLNQPNSLPSADDLSDYVWGFGQFIDHDITLVSNQPGEFFPIQVNFPDPVFNPGGAFPAAFIPMIRSAAVPGTGTDPGNPRRYANQISAFVDGSAIYGPDSIYAGWLRTYKDGKLKTSSGNLLPFNTTDGEQNSPQDPTAPILDNATGQFSKLFVSGDIRANENIFLTAIHTLFMREHNTQCDEIKRAHPEWTDDQIYQHARKIVGGTIASILNREWLPTLGVQLPNYQGYDPTVNPGIFNVFSAAAFRLGHTLLSSNLHRTNNLGGTIPEGDILLRDAFFNPLAIMNAGGVDPLLKGMAHQVQQEFDGKVVDDVRNFLFGGPGSGGMDLAAINMQRGRDRGLADFNTIRADFGMPKYVSFLDLTGDEDLANLMKVAYVTVDNIDPWVGFLVEKKVTGSPFGETLIEVLKEQFGAMRDGDRFYFENDPDLTEDEKARIRNTTMYDVLMRNTSITILQKNVFKMTDHYVMCKATEMAVDVDGQVVADATGEPLTDVEIRLSSEFIDDALSGSDEFGEFDFGPLETCRGYHLQADKEDSYRNGLSVADIVRLRRHLDGSDVLTSPYLRLASDVNASGEISIADLLAMRKVLIGALPGYAETRPWQFVDNTFTFADPTDPFAEIEEAADIHVKPLEEAHSFDVRGIKMGDLNGSVKANGIQGSEVRNNEPLVMEVRDVAWNAGETVRIVVNSPNLADFTGFQFTLQYDRQVLDLATVEEADIAMVDGINFVHVPANGFVAMAADWTNALGPDARPMTLVFKARAKGRLKNALWLSSGIISPEAVTADLDVADVTLRMTDDKQSNDVTAPFQLFGNQPNPFTGQTLISFDMPGGGEATLTVFDLGGRQVLQKKGNYAKGYNQMAVDRHELGAPGLYIYKINTAYGTATQRMAVNE